MWSVVCSGVVRVWSVVCSGVEWWVCSGVGVECCGCVVVW